MEPCVHDGYIDPRALPVANARDPNSSEQPQPSAGEFGSDANITALSENLPGHRFAPGDQYEMSDCDDAGFAAGRLAPPPATGRLPSDRQ
jgi:hypothetical protein